MTSNSIPIYSIRRLPPMCLRKPKIQYQECKTILYTFWIDTSTHFFDKLYFINQGIKLNCSWSQINNQLHLVKNIPYSDRKETNKGTTVQWSGKTNPAFWHYLSYLATDTDFGHISLVNLPRKINRGKQHESLENSCMMHPIESHF